MTAKENESLFDTGDERRLLFILNPRAGTMQANKYLAEIMEIFSAAGYLTTVLVTRKSGDAMRFAARYAVESDVVACAGGDGTLNEVIEGVLTAGADCRIGYIPSGSTNDFGASIGLPKSILEAAERIACGEVRTLDVGSFNGRYFSYIASFGAFTSTSYSVPQNLKNILGHTAYVLQGIRDLINIRPVRIRMVADEGTPKERRIVGDFIFGAVCNAMSVGGILKLESFDIDMNDGLMEVLLIHSPQTLIEANNIVMALLSGSLNASDIVFFSAQKLRMQMESNTHWTLDGEYERGSSTVEIETIRSAIQLLV